MSTKAELEEMTFEELADMAGEKKIRGRSKMDKAELVDALAEKPARKASEPKKATPKPTGTPKSSSSSNGETEELLRDVLKHLDRPMFNGHHHGCPASVNPDKICACRAREGQALRERIEKSLK